MSPRLLFALGAVFTAFAAGPALAGPPAGPADGPSAELSSASPAVKVSGDRRTYHLATPGKSVKITVRGPAQLQLTLRRHVLALTAEAATVVAIDRPEGRARLTLKEKKEGKYDGEIRFAPSAIHYFSVDVPAGTFVVSVHVETGHGAAVSFVARPSTVPAAAPTGADQPVMPLALPTPLPAPGAEKKPGEKPKEEKKPEEELPMPALDMPTPEKKVVEHKDAPREAPREDTAVSRRVEVKPEQPPVPGAEPGASHGAFSVAPRVALALQPQFLSISASPGLDLAYAFALEGRVSAILSLEWYRFGYVEQNGPDHQNTLSYDVIPVTLGVGYELPPWGTFHPAMTAFAGAFYTRGSTEAKHPSTSSTVSGSAFSLGGGLKLGGGFDVGPGRLGLAARFSGARGCTEFVGCDSPLNVGFAGLEAGYRYAF